MSIGGDLAAVASSWGSALTAPQARQRFGGLTMKHYIRLFTFASMACLYCGLAQGHHAISASYDEDSIGTIEGVVVEVFWANPHVHYYMEVVNDAGAAELWDIETGNLIGLSRTGWTKETIELGDRIRVSGHLGRDGTKRLNLDRDSLEIIE